MTGQIPERLFYEGQEAMVGPAPGLPEAHPRIRTITQREAARSREDLMCISTACWRRYQGTWLIEGERLYLVGLVGLRRLVGDGPLLAEWVSATLRARRAPTWPPDRRGLGPLQAQVLTFTVERGIVVAVQGSDDGAATQQAQQHPWELEAARRAASGGSDES